MKLARLINEYRATKGLKPVSPSVSLSMVAQYHVRDLQDNDPNTGTDARGLPCNLHSWSDKGYWTPVCYTSDHQYASGMWFKPSEITRGIYKGYGFEIAVGADWWNASAADALNGWKNSPGHNAVIVEEGAWQGSNWPAMGVGLYRGYAVVWFGKEEDPYREPIHQCQ